jgi:hypothetical protein
MKKYGASSYALAEIVVDYKTKKVDILDPQTKKEFELDFKPPFYLCFFGIILVVICTLFEINYWYFLGITFILYQLNILFPKVANKLHWYEQRLIFDFFRTKKYVILKNGENIYNKIYKLPFKFKNRFIEYKCYGDYKKNLIKIHIFPKEYYYKYKESIEKQTSEWEVWFYFSKIPKKGILTIEWI